MSTHNTVDIEVQGMSCGSCVKHVTQALKPVPGVTDVAVDLQSGHVRVSGSLDAGAEQLVSALTDAGYPAKLSDAGTALAGPSATTAQPNAARGGCCCG
ncbi:MAG: heavy metal-associated domain-containing protein [Burkholderiaceae bacterium]|nr:heavy metal-associated domain-containing protein [Burkholderiaceae bacterium]